MLSIKLIYVSKIISGEKRYEYRKKRCKKDVEVVYMYSSRPVKKVIGEFSVKKIISDSPTKLWNKTCKYGGIDSVSYNKYFDKCDVAYAYVIDKVVLYDNPKNLKDFGIVNVPQSFVYVNK